MINIENGDFLHLSEQCASSQYPNFSLYCRKNIWNPVFFTTADKVPKSAQNLCAFCMKFTILR